MIRQQRRASLFALGSLFLVGCGSPLGEFDERVCIWEPNGLADLSPAGMNYVALTSEDGQVISEWGTPCAAATDANACRANLDTVDWQAIIGTVEPGGTADKDFYAVVYTRGDEVSSPENKSELVDVLGTIDTPSEAVLVTYTHHLRTSGAVAKFCDYDNVRREGPSWVVLVQSGPWSEDGDSGESRRAFTVTDNGEVTSSETEFNH